MRKSTEFLTSILAVTKGDEMFRVNLYEIRKPKSGVKFIVTPENVDLNEAMFEFLSSWDNIEQIEKEGGWSEKEMNDLFRFAGDEITALIYVNLPHPL